MSSSGKGSTRRAGSKSRYGPPSRRSWWSIGILALVIAGGVLLIASSRGNGGKTARGKSPQGTQTYSGLSRNHTDAPVSYPQTPPVGGDHAPVWQDCGFYPQPIPSERGVHSMEHGAVWITYRPGLAAADLRRLRDLAHGYVLVSPFDNLPSPVVASAWGRQLRLDSVSDPRLDSFVEAFRQGPQTPEPGARCTGGEGTPG